LGLVGLPQPAPELPLGSPEAARLLPERRPVLASIFRPAGGPEEAVEVTPLPSARFADGTALAGGDVADSLRRLLLSQSPYAALLSPVAHLEETLQAATQKQAPLRLQLEYPWPDFEASLCHPAFTPTRAGAPDEGVGLYGRRADGHFAALAGAPGGPPFPASLAFSTLPARAAGRLLARGEVHAVLGESSSKDGAPLLFATYLVWRPGSLPEGARAALLRVDWPALVRTFVAAPAAALRSYLPEALGEASPVPLAPQPPAAPRGPTEVRTFRLGYAVELPEQRAVAERLQVLLHDAGYTVRLVPDSRANLARARASGALEAALVSVLLPPLPAPALAVVLGLGGDAALVHRELQALGAVADADARGARARARARELAQELPLLPLYVRGLRVQLSEALVDARRDAFGLLVLDDAWLSR
jgi:hypothetical protein